MNALAREAFLVRRLEDLSNLRADGFDQTQLDVHIATFDIQYREKLVGFGASEARILFSDDSLNAIGVEDFRVGQMANDLANRPPSGHGNGVDFLGRQPAERPTHGFGPCQVAVDNFADARFHQSTNRLIARQEKFGRYSSSEISGSRKGVSAS
jgi:hypothetical protein